MAEDMVDQAGLAGLSLSDRYRLDTVIATGGMGTIWSADDTFLGRRVAVKVLTWESDADGAGAAGERVRREARAAASLRHPSIACVYDYGEQGGIAFLVMELLDGESLAARLRRHGALPPAEAARVAAGVAEALDAAHLAGIVHRDVKPGNIMLEASGAVKLLDFGIAAISGQRPRAGQERLLGTAAYLSPEWGDDGPADPAGDVYSLGVVVYEMLAGRPPFTGDSLAAVAAAHAASPPPPLCLLDPEVPAAMAAVCERALAKDPAARPPSAGAFAAQLSAGLPRTRHPGASQVRAPETLAAPKIPAGAPLAGPVGSVTEPVWPVATAARRGGSHGRRGGRSRGPGPGRRWRSLAVALVAVIALAFALQGTGVLPELLGLRGGGPAVGGTPVTNPSGDGTQLGPTPPTVTTGPGNGRSHGRGSGNDHSRDGGSNGNGDGGDQQRRSNDHSGPGHGGNG
jgi:serine/threonine-protein kinase